MQLKSHRFAIWSFILVIWLTPVRIFADNPMLDSLQAAFDGAEDSTKVLLAGELFWQSLVAGQMADAESYALEELSLAKVGNWSIGIAQAYNDLGIIKFYQGEHKEALSYYDSSLTIRANIKDLKGMAAIYNKQGLIYQKQGRHEAFIESQQMALVIFEQINDSINVGTSLNNLGDGYFQIRAYDKAIEIHKQAIKIRKKLSDSVGLATSYLNLANCYLNDSTAKRYFLLALPIFTRANDKNAIAGIYNNLSLTCAKMGDLPSAERYIHKSIAIKVELEDEEGLATAYMTLCDVLINLERYQASKSALDKAVRLSNELGIEENFEYIYYYKAAYFYGIGQSDSAFIYQRRCTDLKNALYNDELYNHIAEMRTRYETEKKEGENVLLAKENELANALLEREKDNRRLLTTVLSAIILFILLLSLLLFYKRKLSTEKRISSIEKKNFNAIIEAEENERTRIARELHDGLGQVLSTAKLNVAALDPQDKEEQDLHDKSLGLIDDAVIEVRAISHNLMPIALTNGGLVVALEELVSKLSGNPVFKIDLKVISLTEKLSKSTEIALYRVVQEVVNNSIKHAQASKLSILIQAKGNHLLLAIADDGVGFDPNNIPKSKGIGWKNIFSRISLLSGKIEINSAQDKGTELQINIPIK